MAKEKKGTPVEETKEEVVEEEKVVGGWEIPIPEGAEFGGVPPGTYLSKCNEEPKETVSSKGDPQTEFQFVISDPQFPDYEGREGHYYCSRKAKSWWNMTQTLEAMGVQYVIDKEKKIFRFNPMDCVGAICKTVWEENTFNNRTRPKIIRVISAAEKVESLEGIGTEDLPF